MDASVEAIPATPEVGRPHLRSGVRTAHDAAGVRLVFRALLFGGSSVPAWHDDAACGSHPWALFFPEPDGRPPRPSSVRAAKQICRRCPVRAACLADVMAHESPSHRYGVVGGLSPAERRRLHREPRAVTS